MTDPSLFYPLSALLAQIIVVRTSNSLNYLPSSFSDDGGDTLTVIAAYPCGF